MFVFEPPTVTYPPTANRRPIRLHSNGDATADGMMNADLGNELLDPCDTTALARSTVDLPLQEHPTQRAASTIQGNEAVASLSNAPKIWNDRTGTPPIDISKTPTSVRGRSSAMLDPTPKASNLAGRAHRKKKRAQKAGTLASLTASRAITPIASCDEDSDFSNGYVFSELSFPLQALPESNETCLRSCLLARPVMQPTLTREWKC